MTYLIVGLIALVVLFLLLKSLGKIGFIALILGAYYLATLKK
jgi:hypothetical protein